MGEYRSTEYINMLYALVQVNGDFNAASDQYAANHPDADGIPVLMTFQRL